MSGGSGTAVANLVFDFDLFGNLTQRLDHNTHINEIFAHDSLNRLTQATVNSNPSHTVSYDAIGNIAAKSDAGTYTYGTTYSGSGAPTYPHAVQSITGARATTYAYDGNGNMTSGAGRTATWTSFDMTASIVQGTTTVALTYDADHARVTQSSTVASQTTGTIYLNDAASGAMTERVTNPDASVVWNEYLMVGGAMVARHQTAASPSTLYPNLRRIAIGLQ